MLAGNFLTDWCSVDRGRNRRLSSPGYQVYSEVWIWTSIIPTKITLHRVYEGTIFNSLNSAILAVDFFDFQFRNLEY